MPFQAFVGQLAERHHERAAATHVGARLFAQRDEQRIDAFGGWAAVLDRSRFEPSAIALLGAFHVGWRPAHLSRGRGDKGRWAQCRPLPQRGRPRSRGCRASRTSRERARGSARESLPPPPPALAPPPPDRARQCPPASPAASADPRVVSHGRRRRHCGLAPTACAFAPAAPEGDYSAAEWGPSLPCTGSTKAPPRCRLRKSPGVLPVQRTNAW